MRLSPRGTYAPSLSGIGYMRGMFDAKLRPLMNPPLDAAGRLLAARGVTANALTWSGLVVGLAGATAIAAGAPVEGLALFALNRIMDGLDGAVARHVGATDYGGFADIVCDFLIYAAIPLAFAVWDPGNNALAAATLLVAFIASGVTFLAFAALAARRGVTTSAQGVKSIYYLSGLAEGGETIACFAAMCLWPAWFATLAYVFAAICAVSAAARIAAARRMLH